MQDKREKEPQLDNSNSDEDFISVGSLEPSCPYCVMTAYQRQLQRLGPSCQACLMQAMPYVEEMYYVDDKDPQYNYLYNRAKVIIKKRGKKESKTHQNLSIKKNIRQLQNLKGNEASSSLEEKNQLNYSNYGKNNVGVGERNINENLVKQPKNKDCSVKLDQLNEQGQCEEICNLNHPPSKHSSLINDKILSSYQNEIQELKSKIDLYKTENQKLKTEKESLLNATKNYEQKIGGLNPKNVQNYGLNNEQNLGGLGYLSKNNCDNVGGVNDLSDTNNVANAGLYDNNSLNNRLNNARIDSNVGVVDNNNVPNLNNEVNNIAGLHGFSNDFASAGNANVNDLNNNNVLINQGDNQMLGLESNVNDVNAYANNIQQLPSDHLQNIPSNNLQPINYIDNNQQNNTFVPNNSIGTAEHLTHINSLAGLDNNTNTDANNIRTLDSNNLNTFANNTLHSNGVNNINTLPDINSISNLNKISGVNNITTEQNTQLNPLQHNIDNLNDANNMRLSHSNSLNKNLATLDSNAHNLGSNTLNSGNLPNLNGELNTLSSQNNNNLTSTQGLETGAFGCVLQTSSNLNRNSDVVANDGSDNVGDFSKVGLVVDVNNGNIGNNVDVSQYILIINQLKEENKKQKEEFEAKYDSLAQQLNVQIETDKGAINSLNEQYEKKIKELESELENRNKSNNQNERNDVNSYISEINSLKLQIQQLTSNNSDGAHNVAEYEKMIRELNQKIYELQQNLQSKEKTLEESAGENTQNFDGGKAAIIGQYLKLLEELTQRVVVLEKKIGDKLAEIRARKDDGLTKVSQTYNYHYQQYYHQQPYQTFETFGIKTTGINAVENDEEGIGTVPIISRIRVENNNSNYSNYMTNNQNYQYY